MQKNIIRVVFMKSLIFSLCTGSKLIEKSSHVANREFQHMSVTCIFWRYTDPENVNDFLKSFNGLTQTISVDDDGDVDQNQIKECKQSILFVSDAEGFKIILHLMNNQVKDPIYMLVLITKPMSATSVLTDFTKSAWENDIGNIIIFSWNEQNDKVNVTTYLPYSNGKCDNYNAVTKEYEKNYNFIRKYKNFNKCSIKLTMVDLIPYVTFQEHDDGFSSIGGIDGDVLTVVLDKLNATAKTVKPPVNEIGDFINGTGTGVFGDVVYGNVDIMVPGIAINVRRYAVTQLSHVYQSVDVVWCGPNRREIYPWAKVLLPFLSNITPFIALAFVLFIVSVLLIEYFGIKKVKFRNIIFGTTALFLGQTMNFERNYWLSNSVFMIWIWFCQVIRVAYQGDLINNFGLVILEPPMTHLKDALQNVDEHGGSAGYVRYYRDTPAEYNYQDLTYIDEPVYLKQISEGRRFLLVVDELLVWYLNNPVQILEERMTRMPVGFYLRPHWPATKEVDDTLVRVIEAGIVARVLRRFKDKPLFKDPVREAKVTKPMELSTLSACFYGLIFMYIICFLIFCLEICFFKFKKRNENKTLT